MPKYRFDEIAINSTEKKKPVEADKDSYIGLEHLDSGCLEVTRWGAEVAPVGDKLVMRKGDVLFGRRRAYQKKVAIAPFDGIFSAHGMVLRPVETVISKDFFPFFIGSDYFLDAAIKISVGSLSPTINWHDLAKLEFQIPTLEEQAALADILWAMNRLKVAYNNLLQQADDLVQSQFVEMFGANRSDRKSRKLRDCCSCISGGKTPSMDHPEFYGGDIPFIKSGDVKQNNVSSGSLWLTEEALQKGGATLLPTGTVIVVIRSAALRHEFHVAVTDNPVVINQDLKAFQPNSDFIPSYLQWSILSHEKEILGKVQSVLTSHIEMSDLLAIPVVEAEIDEQKAFEAFVAQTDKSKYRCGLQDAFINVAQQVTTYT